MKKFIFLLTILITAATFAQQGINYKALIKDANGNVLVSQTIDVKFTIIADTGPTDVYAEIHTGVLTDANGIIVLNIGEGNDILADFSGIDWSSDTHSLKTEIDTEQDGTFEFMSTTQFMAVPYALHAETAASATYATTANNITGLEALNEGNGIGWRLKGRFSSYYANIGSNAVDLSTINNGVGDAEGASGEYSIAMGLAVTASGDYSTAMGRGTSALGDYSRAMGSETTASGFYSTAMGYNTIAPSFAETVIGFNNTEYMPNNATSWDASDRLFVVGNGTNTSNRSDALTIFKNGTTAINGTLVVTGTLAVSGAVVVNSVVVHSDRRLKKDIEALPYGLKEILQLQPKAYNWKARTQAHKSLGLIAQDVQPLIKEIVIAKDDAQKTLGINYTELIPVLINAIKEQQTVIDSQQADISKLKTMVQQLLLKDETVAHRE